MDITRKNNVICKIVAAVFSLMFLSVILQSCATVVEEGEGYRIFERNKSFSTRDEVCFKCGELASTSYCKHCGAIIRFSHRGGAGEEVEITTANQVLITQLAIGNRRWSVRCAAIEKITDQKLLAEIAGKDSDGWVRITALRYITDQKILVEIARKNSDEWVRKAAVKKITDRNVLAEIAEKDSNGWVRRAANEKLSEF